MRLLMILLILCHFGISQSFSYSNSDNGFIHSYNQSYKNKKKVVFLKDGVFIVHIYGNRYKENKNGDDERYEDSDKHFRVKVGKGLRFFNLGSAYQRILVERRYVDGKFIVTADNLRKEQIDEIKKSSLSQEDKDELIEEIEFTDFENKAEELSYMVSIIKDHIDKGKLIRL